MPKKAKRKKAKKKLFFQDNRPRLCDFFLFFRKAREKTVKNFSKPRS
jgi:hypothetical protein